MVRREDLGDHRGASGNLFGEIINERNWRLTDVVAMYHLKFGKYGDHINEGMVSKWARGVVRPGPLRAVRLAELMTQMEGRMLSATVPIRPIAATALEPHTGCRTAADPPQFRHRRRRGSGPHSPRFGIARPPSRGHPAPH
jgi:hypothetical protein